MAESDTTAVWMVDDTEHPVLDEFVSTRETVEQQIDQIVALCADEPRWTMDVRFGRARSCRRLSGRARRPAAVELVNHW